MEQYHFADLCTQVENAGEYTRKVMEKYLLKEEDRRRPDIRILVTPQMTEEERQIEGDTFEDGYLESMAVYRAFCEQALFYDVLFFHASAVAKDGEAYLFSGPSGVGKSTHAEKWIEAFGRDTFIINDDKPLLRFLKDEVYVYGTPWDGKFHRNTDVCLPVKGICMLRQSRENTIRRLTWQEAQHLAESQSFRAGNWENRQKTGTLIRMLLNRIPVYSLECNDSTQAAVTAWEGMNKENRRRVDHRSVMPCSQRSSGYPEDGCSGSVHPDRPFLLP